MATLDVFSVPYWLLINLAFVLGLALTYSFVWWIYSITFRSKVEKQWQHARSKIAYNYSKSIINFGVEVVNIILNFISCGTFIYLTVKISEIEDPDLPAGRQQYSDLFREPLLIWGEFTISLFFILEFLWHLLLADDKIKFVFNVYSFVDLLTSIPGVAAPGLGFYFYGFQSFRFMRGYRSLQYFRTAGYAKLGGLEAQLFLLMFTLISVLFCASGLIFVVENPIVVEGGAVTNLFDGLYFVMVSITTVGYGDISAKTDGGRVIVLVLLVSALAVVPYQVGLLAALFQENLGRTRFKGSGHVVVAMHRESSIIPWLKEFYHQDRDDRLTNVCLFLPEVKLPRATNMYLNRPDVRYRVSTVFGNSLLDKDLRRVNVKDAQAVLIIADRGAEDPEMEDAKTIMEAISFRRHVPDIPIYVQLLTTRHKAALVAAGVEAIVCVNELRMSFLTSSCLCNGLSTLLTNFIVSHSHVPHANDPIWLSQFRNGLGHEIYLVNNMRHFAGCTYGETVFAIYKEFGILVMGLITDRQMKSTERNPDGVFRIIVNPNLDHVIHSTDQIIVAAQDQGEVDQVLSFDVEPWMAANRALMSNTFAEGRKNTTLAVACPYDLTKTQHQKDEEVEHIEQKHIVIEHYSDIGLKGHVIVTGKWSEIVDFLVDLRKCSMKTQTDIVILKSKFPDDNLWNRISHMTSIYLVQGIPTEYEDLERAGWSEASQIVILSDNGNRNDFTIDAKSVMLYNMTRRKKNLEPIVDLVHRSNVRFLDHVRRKNTKMDDEQGLIDHLESPPYACGHAFYSSCLENLLSQVYANKWVVDILEQMMHGSVFSLSIGDHFPQFQDKSYSELLAYALGAGYLSLGLFRVNTDSDYPRRYVVTNPPPTTVLRHDDQVYFLISQVDFPSQVHTSSGRKKSISKRALHKRESTDEPKRRNKKEDVNDNHEEIELTPYSKMRNEVGSALLDSLEDH